MISLKTKRIEVSEGKKKVIKFLKITSNQIVGVARATVNLVALADAGHLDIGMEKPWIRIKMWAKGTMNPSGKSLTQRKVRSNNNSDAQKFELTRETA